MDAQSGLNYIASPTGGGNNSGSRSISNNQHGGDANLGLGSPVNIPEIRTHEHDGGPGSWLSLPRKDQLAILFLCRLVDFLQVASLQAYVFYQLKSFHKGDGERVSDAEIATQAGILQGCFTGAQVLTAVAWGKAADARWCGRKNVLLLGLGGTAVSCLGYGFATNFAQAAFWRASGGAINGTVGIVRTMVSEIIKEKKHQPRAFLLLPMSFNIAGILGPIIGGFLADPAINLPGLFGSSGILRFNWLMTYPYALPSLCNAVFLMTAAGIVFFLLEETSKVRRNRFDLGRHLTSWFSGLIRRGNTDGYSSLETHDVIVEAEVPMQDLEDLEDSDAEKSPARPAVPSQIIGRLSFRRMWTRNVILTLVTSAFYDFHLGAFSNLWALFLSTPRSTAPWHLPFLFTGGLGMPVATVGLATSILGILGMSLQVTLYPPVHSRLGTLRSFQYFLPLFPLAYFLTPFLVILPSATHPPEPAAGLPIWFGIVLVQVLQVTARTFTLPASIILLNNCSPHPSVLGTVHGLGQSVSAGFRTLGPVVSGWLYGKGLDLGVVGLSWWCTALVSTAGCVIAVWLYEGSGHEIILSGEREETEGTIRDSCSS